LPRPKRCYPEEVPVGLLGQPLQPKRQRGAKFDNLVSF
jgi:hypothetical protein